MDKEGCSALQQALSGIKVIDLTQLVAGPYCTKLLADYGADVIKVEKPGEGDMARRIGPFFGDDPHPEKSGPFLHLNTNKRGITLNLKSKTGKHIFLKLVEGADIVVESFSPRVMPSLGLHYEILEKINPKLVMTSISNFGQTGPYRDYKLSEIVLFGMGGPMHNIGLGEREPLKLPGTTAQFYGGTMASVATMMAFLSAESTGIGQWVDISLLETQLSSVDQRMVQLLGYQYSGRTGLRLSIQQVGGYPSGNYPCKDGYFYVIAMWPAAFPGAAKLIGRPEWVTDPGFASPEGQMNLKSRAEFEALWYPFIMEHTKKEITEAGQAVGLPVSPLNTTQDLLNDEHLQARDFWVEIDHPFTGKVTYPGAPFKMEETPWQLRRRAPLLGEHNKEIYEELGYSGEDVVRLREANVI